MIQYLQSTKIINWQHPKVLEKAIQLAQNCQNKQSIAKQCFEFVRDEIQHSWDHQKNPVTCKASEVLEFKTGFCYAKSHLLAALLRANDIPTGFCYQRLTITDQPPFCLHSLNAIYLEDFGWYKVDARGNKSGVNAQFNPPKEKLAFEIKTKGEMEFSKIYADPLDEVINTLERFSDIKEIINHLPDYDVENKKLIER